jgi:hypothetical protein
MMHAKRLHGCLGLGVIVASLATTAAAAPSAAPIMPPKPSPYLPLSQQVAPPGAARVSEAREHFNRGLQYFKDGGLEAALSEFLRANELAPSYRLFFNIAQVQYELRNYVDAKRAFQSYLAGADADLPPDRRALVESELTKLDRLVAQFSVRTSVPGVQITVDGIPAGQAALDNLVLVNTNPGVRRVSAAKAGFVPASMVVTVTPGERRRLVFELAPVASARMSLPPPALASMGARQADLAASAEPPGHTRLWVSVATAATLATATGVFALLTRHANTEFEHQLARVPNDPATLDDARHRLSRYALTADLLAGATAVATGLSLYFTFADDPAGSRRAGAPAGLGLRGKF